MNCSHCHYGVLIESIFCSNCGEVVASFTIKPISKNLSLFASGEYSFEIRNQGMVDITITGCSDKAFKLNFIGNIPPNSTKSVGMTYDQLQVGDSGKFDLLVSPCEKKDDLKYEFSVVDKPVMLFSIKHAAQQGGEYLIPASLSENLEISLESSSALSLIKQPLVFDENGTRLSEIPLNNLETNFSFDVIGNNGYRANSSIILDVEFFFSGLTVTESFTIKVIDVAELTFVPEKCFHTSKIEGNQFSPTRMDLIEGSTRFSELFLGFKVKGSELKIKDVVLPTIIYCEEEQIELPQSIVKVMDSIIEREFKVNDIVELELEVNTGLINESLNDSFIDKLCEFKVVIVTQDLANSFETSVSATISFTIARRNDIAITIDFGTSNSCIAYLPYGSDDQNPRIAELPLIGGVVQQIPSMIKFDNFYDENNNIREFLSEKISVGPAVVDFANNPEADLTMLNSIAWGFKKLLSKPAMTLHFSDVESRTKVYTPKELVALFFNKLIQHFENTYPYSVTELNVTYPAAFSSIEKQSLLEGIYKLPRFSADNVFLEITEPVALAVSYANKVASNLRLNERKNVAVFDCGGGTTDLTIASLECKYDEYNEPMTYLAFQASDGVYSPKHRTTVGGDFFTYLISTGYKANAEAQLGFKIPYPDKFKLPIELVNDHKAVKYNSAKIMLTANMRKIKGFSSDPTAFAYKLETGKEEVTPAFEHVTVEQEEELLIEDLARAFCKLNVMSFLLSEQSVIQQIIADSLEVSTSIDLQQTLLVYANATFLKVFTYDANEPKQMKQIMVSDTCLSFEDAMKCLRDLHVQGHIKNQLVDTLILIGFDKNNEVERQEIQELQPEAFISFFDANIDTLILGGNSSKHPYVKAVAEKMVSRASVQNDESMKVGVAIGACLVSQLGEEARSFDIQKNELLPYSIGYAYRGSFLPLLKQWEEVSDNEEQMSRQKKISPRMADKTISIYENRNIYKDKPKLSTPHDAMMQPIIGTVSISDDLIGKYVRFSLCMDDNKRLSYRLYKSDTANGEFAPVSLFPTPLNGNNQ